MNIKLYPKEVLKVNLYLILFLLCANILGVIVKYYLSIPSFGYVLIGLFDFNTEKNIPTLYSSIALLVVSMLLLSIALTHKKLKLSYNQLLYLVYFYNYTTFKFLIKG